MRTSTPKLYILIGMNGVFALFGNEGNTGVCPLVGPNFPVPSNLPALATP